MTRQEEYIVELAGLLHRAGPPVADAEIMAAFRRIEEQERGQQSPYRRIQTLLTVGYLAADSRCLDAAQAIVTCVLENYSQEIRREGLAACIPLPDDAHMRKAFRRPVRTRSPEWVRQGHVHVTDGVSLTDRIRALHGILMGEVMG